MQLRLPSDVAARLGKQLRIDVRCGDTPAVVCHRALTTAVRVCHSTQSKFLADMGIMDYSLLLGVHRRKFRLRAQVSGRSLP